MEVEGEVVAAVEEAVRAVEEEAVAAVVREARLAVEAEDAFNHIILGTSPSTLTAIGSRLIISAVHTLPALPLLPVFASSPRSIAPKLGLSPPWNFTHPGLAGAAPISLSEEESSRGRPSTFSSSSLHSPPFPSLHTASPFGTSLCACLSNFPPPRNWARRASCIIAPVGDGGALDLLLDLEGDLELEWD